MAPIGGLFFFIFFYLSTQRPSNTQLTDSQFVHTTHHYSTGGDNANIESINPGNNLFVNSLATKTETGDLEDLFGKYGKVREKRREREPLQEKIDPSTMVASLYLH
jgi:RNA recognition motif-containing protein